jgi:hypothetical protein
MCIFSGDILEVTSTKIFAAIVPSLTATLNDSNAKAVKNDRQVIVYEMAVASAKPQIAMILPIPSSSQDEDAVEFIDLSSFLDFFNKLDVLIPDPYLVYRKQTLRADTTPRLLKVHVVGDFIASFVPNVNDFARLDERFRLPTGVVEKHMEYVDWGFVVFTLASLSTEIEKRHPMAFTFPRRDVTKLFFPTLHVHDGHDVPREAKYDHDLYVQLPESETSLLDPSNHLANLFKYFHVMVPMESAGSRKVELEFIMGSIPGYYFAPAEPTWRQSLWTLCRCGFASKGEIRPALPWGIVNAALPVYRARCKGTLVNQDVWVACDSKVEAVKWELYT